MKGKRLISKGIRQLELETFEIPPVPDDSILVRNECTAVSAGTELWIWVHGSEYGRELVFPRPTGYCNAGIAEVVGKNVKGVSPGDRVAGQGNHASHSVIGPPYSVVPGNVSPEAASLLTMAAISMHGARAAKVELGESAVITGMGLVGQFALSFAKLNGGLPVIAVDVNDKRLEKAKERGADLCINPQKVKDVPAAVREACVEDGANCVFEASGIPSVYPMAVKTACFGGRVISLGSPRGTVEFNFFDEIHLREISLLGAFHPATPEEGNEYFRWTKRRERGVILRLLSEGSLTAEDLITHTAEPKDCLEVYNMLADDPSGALGVVFDWRNI